MAGAASTVGPGLKQPLDDVMLAMDVVDTLRRRERLVMRELDVEGRENELKERLRKIYEAQGIEVPDRILEAGVAALKEDRFAYNPPASGLGVTLARVYVSRSKWGRWVLGLVGLVCVALAFNYFVFTAPNAALTEDLAAARANALQIAVTDNAKATAQRLHNAGRAALSTGDTRAARTALRELEGVRRSLEQAYTLRIVNRPGERSGVWRVPDINTQARNYYLIVEAIDPTGKVLAVSVENEETGQTERVRKWGLRVDEAVFERVARDKKDNGIIERNRFGVKKQGHLVPEYEIPTTGTAITQW